MQPTNIHANENQSRHTRACIHTHTDTDTE